MRSRGKVTLLLTACGALVACSSGSSGDQRDPSRGPSPPPVILDYSQLQIPDASETLRAPVAEEELLLALRNGLRLSIAQPSYDFTFADTVLSFAEAGPPSYSRTTQQVDGVDEADLVKYDGTHLFIVHPEPTEVTSIEGPPRVTHNVLSIVRTDSANATTQPVSTFTLEGDQSEPPLIYLLEAETGQAESIAAVSHETRIWALVDEMPLFRQADTPWGDLSRIQLLDVSDPYNVRQTWKLELDGWLRTSRKIGDMLYVVTSFRPWVDIDLPASTPERQQANEQRIREADIESLLPHYRIDDTGEQPLVRASDCVVGSELQPFHAYDHLLVMTAIDLRHRRITDSTCLSTNLSGVYVSRSSLYIGGARSRSDPSGVTTVLHKFSLAEGDIAYAASGTVAGSIGWTNPSYYMDERGDELRILTTRWPSAGEPEHRLSILHQAGNDLALVSTLPNDARPSKIGKPGEMMQGVRFLADRAYVVTARQIDPFYVIDLSNPSDPFIAGEVELPGFSTYLHPLNAHVVASVGYHTTAQGAPRGVKVELFDVSEPDTPRSVGVQVFGDTGSQSEAVFDPHAVAFRATTGDAYRIALPIDVFETPDPNHVGVFAWTYSGLHVLEAQNLGSGSPRLDFRGVIRTNESSSGTRYPPPLRPQRGVLHGDSVFSVYGAETTGRLWEDLGPRTSSWGLQL